MGERTTASACATYLLVAAFWTLRLLECSHLLMSCMSACLSLSCMYYYSRSTTLPCSKISCTGVTNTYLQRLSFTFSNSSPGYGDAPLVGFSKPPLYFTLSDDMFANAWFKQHVTLACLK